MSGSALRTVYCPVNCIVLMAVTVTARPLHMTVGVVIGLDALILIVTTLPTKAIKGLAGLFDISQNTVAGLTLSIVTWHDDDGLSVAVPDVPEGVVYVTEHATGPGKSLDDTV
jgi:uncharacterized iron-regulated membrane protein